MTKKAKKNPSPNGTVNGRINQAEKTALSNIYNDDKDSLGSQTLHIADDSFQMFEEKHESQMRRK